MTGIQGDGVFAILIGVAIVAIMAAAYVEGPSGAQRTLILGLGILGLVLYVFEAVNLSKLELAQIGSGLILGAAGGLAVVLFSGSIGKRISPPA